MESKTGYGFFQRKDIEAWVYKSADEAKEFGVPYGEQAVDKKPGQTDYLIPRVNRYHAYVIVANLMLLCETEILDCQKLIDKLEDRDISHESIIKSEIIFRESVTRLH